MITLLVMCFESLFSENCLNRIGKSGEIVRTRNGNELNITILQTVQRACEEFSVKRIIGNNADKGTVF